MCLYKYDALSSVCGGTCVICVFRDVIGTCKVRDNFVSHFSPFASTWAPGWQSDFMAYMASTFTCWAISWHRFQRFPFKKVCLLYISLISIEVWAAGRLQKAISVLSFICRFDPLDTNCSNLDHLCTYKNILKIWRDIIFVCLHGWKKTYWDIWTLWTIHMYRDLDGIWIDSLKHSLPALHFT